MSETCTEKTQCFSAFACVVARSNTRCCPRREQRKSLKIGVFALLACGNTVVCPRGEQRDEPRNRLLWGLQTDAGTRCLSERERENEKLKTSIQILPWTGVVASPPVLALRVDTTFGFQILHVTTHSPPVFLRQDLMKFVNVEPVNAILFQL